MNEQEKLMVFMAHAITRQENDLQHLKAVMMEKLNSSIEKLKQEQEVFWYKRKNFRVHGTLKPFQVLQQNMEPLPEGLTLDM